MQKIDEAFSRLQSRESEGKKKLQICDIRNKYKRSITERQKIKRNENRR